MSTEFLNAMKMLYDNEKNARDLYAGYLEKFSDPRIRAVLEVIKSEEEEHMRIVQKMMEVMGQP